MAEFSDASLSSQDSPSILRWPVVVALVVFGIGAPGMLAAYHSEYPMLHAMFDTGAFVLTAMLAVLLWELAMRSGHSLVRAFALVYGVVAIFELVHAMMAVEWGGRLAWIAEYEEWLRPSTWGSPAYLVPLGLGLAMNWELRREPSASLIFAGSLLLLGVALLVVFLRLPRYEPPGLLGVSRPTLLLVPALWLAVGMHCWRWRQRNPVLRVFAGAAVLPVLTHVVMLYSQAPHDGPAVVAHFGKVLASVALAGELVRLGKRDVAERRRNEEELQAFSAQLDQRVKERTLQLEGEIQERRRTELALRASQEQLETVVANLTEGLVLADLDGRLIKWNRAGVEMHGLSVEEEGHTHVVDYDQNFALFTLEGTPVPVADWPISRVLRGEQLRDYELCVRRKDRDWERFFSYGGEIVREPSGRQVALLTITDVTARRKTEVALQQLNTELEARVQNRTAALEAVNRELEAFSYSISHDLRAPLRAIDGFAQALVEDFGESLPEDGRRYLRTIRGGTQRMGNLIDDLLTFSRLSRQKFQRESVAMGALATEVLAELVASQSLRRIETQVEPLPDCEGDRALLRQVWTNLLDNALKYTRKSAVAKIHVGARPGENGRPVYYVQDNGTGFDMKYVHKLFGVFQRLHRMEEYEGTGVGLALVQRIVQRHGGRAWAEAVPDRGATFFFTLNGVSES